MGTVVEKLQKALENKEDIKQALKEKGQTVGNNTSTYGNAIRNIKDDFAETFIKFNEDTLTEFKFPYGMKKIKTNFYTGNNITRWYFPATLTEIGDRSMNVNVGRNNPPYLQFFYAGSLEQWFKIPKGEYTSSMRHCYSYSSYSDDHYIIYPNNSEEYFSGDVIIPEGTETIPVCAYAFLMTNPDRKIVNSILRIPSSVKTIGDGAFTKMNGIKNIIFENTTDFIELGNSVFYGFNIKYSEDANLPQYFIDELVMPKLRKIPVYTLLNVGVKNLVLQEGLEEIENYGLNQMCWYDDGSGNFNFTFPTTLTKIGENGFAITNSRGKSYKFKNLVIPETIKNIGGYFTSRFETITFLSTVPCTITSSTFYSLTNAGFKIYVPKGSGNVYKNATNWSRFASYIYEPYIVNLTIPNGLINNPNITYSLNNGNTYQQFNDIYMSLNEVSTIRIKSTDSSQTILIGTTEGGNDVGTISNSEITLSFTTDTNVYLTIQ